MFCLINENIAVYTPGVKFSTSLISDVLFQNENVLVYTPDVKFSAVVNFAILIKTSRKFMRPLALS